MREKICIVGLSCILPGISSISEFWDVLKKNSSLNKPLHFDSVSLNSKKSELQSVHFESKDARKLLTKSIEQIQEHILLPQKRTSLFIGNLYENENTTFHKTSGIEQDLSFVIKSNPAFSNFACIDAACASSLAAVEVGVLSLMNADCDVAIVGGMNLNNSLWVNSVFDKAKVLGIPKPFCADSTGIMIGEGIVLLALQREHDALKKGHKILGYVAGIGSSGDGKHPGLFEPLQKGQEIALERAYKNLDMSKVKYIECHGTGTAKGDLVEIQAIRKTFSQKIFISSNKHIFGHTQGAAGAINIAKVVLEMLYKEILPSTYITDYIGDLFKEEVSYISQKDSKELSNTGLDLVGTSAFGFGGINYHIVISKSPVFLEIEQKEIVLLKQKSYPLIDAKQKIFWITKENQPSIDIYQKSAATHFLSYCKDTNIFLELLSLKDTITVLSNASYKNIFMNENMKQIFFPKSIKSIQSKLSSSEKSLQDIYNSFSWFTEDSGPGMLNAVISGRIANGLDFTAVPFTVSASKNTFNTIAIQQLQKDTQCVFTITCKKDSIDIAGFATVPFALQHTLPISKIIHKDDVRGED